MSTLPYHPISSARAIIWLYPGLIHSSTHSEVVVELTLFLGIPRIICDANAGSPPFDDMDIRCHIVVRLSGEGRDWRACTVTGKYSTVLYKTLDSRILYLAARRFPYSTSSAQNCRASRQFFTRRPRITAGPGKFTLSLILNSCHRRLGPYLM